MQNWKRLFYFLLLNIVVSALTTWVVSSSIRRKYSQADCPQLSFGADDESQTKNDSLGTAPGGTDTSGITGTDVYVLIGQLEIDSIIGIGDLENERVEVRHVGDEEISLAGWQLQDEDGSSFTFPSLTMFPGGSVTVYTKSGVSTVKEFYWRSVQSIWEEGEEAYLVDPNGDIQAVYLVP